MRSIWSTITIPWKESCIELYETVIFTKFVFCEVGHWWKISFMMDEVFNVMVWFYHPCSAWSISHCWFVYIDGPVQDGNNSIANTQELLQSCSEPSIYDTGSVDTWRPRQNGRHFADDIFKCIFLNENVWISLKISLKFVPNVRINNIPALV